MSSEADEKAITVTSNTLSSLPEWEARTGNMAFEISTISIGAVLVLLLLMALIFTPGQRGKSEKDHVNYKNSGIYLCVVLVCLGWSYNSMMKSLCLLILLSHPFVSEFSYDSTAAESLPVSLLLLVSHPPWSPRPLIHWQHERADTRSPTDTPDQSSAALRKHLPS